MLSGFSSLKNDFLFESRFFLFVVYSAHFSHPLRFFQFTFKFCKHACLRKDCKDKHYA